jgi:hypothetical protein
LSDNAAAIMISIPSLQNLNTKLCFKKKEPEY